MRCRPMRAGRLAAATLVALVVGAAAAASACSVSRDAPPISGATGPTGGSSAGPRVGDGGSTPDAISGDAHPGGETEAGADAARDAPADASPPEDSGLIDVSILPDAADLDGATPCGFLSCSPGCCSSAGVCLPGTATEACGSGGEACLDCAATAQICEQSSCQ